MFWMWTTLLGLVRDELVEWSTVASTEKMICRSKGPLLHLAINRSSHLNGEPCTYCDIRLEERNWFNPNWDFYGWLDSDLHFPTPSSTHLYKGPKIPRNHHQLPSLQLQSLLSTIYSSLFTLLNLSHYFHFTLSICNSTTFSSLSVLWLLCLPHQSRTLSQSQNQRQMRNVPFYDPANIYSDAEPCGFGSMIC